MAADTKPQAPKPATKKAVEPKDVRFRRLAQRRVGKAIKVLTQIENLTNPSAYEWTPEQAEKIGKVLGSALDRILAGLAKKQQPKATAFTL